MTGFGPDVGDHASHAVAADRVLEQVGELALAELDERLLGIAETDHGLFEERQRLVDVLGLFLRDALRLGLGEALGAGQVDEIEFGERVLLVGGGYRFALDPDREYAMRTRALLVEYVRAYRPVRLALEQQIQRVLLVRHGLVGEAFHEYVAAVVEDRQARAVLGGVRELDGREQVVELLVVNL